MIPEAEIIQALSAGEVGLPPLVLHVIGLDRPLGGQGINGKIDAVVQAKWNDRSWDFAAEVKRTATPKLLQEGLGIVRPAAEQLGLHPLLVVPYLSAANIEILERLEVSGIDLSGNGIVIVPKELLIVRTGNPNRFPHSTPIRNVYRGDSSLVARAFLAHPIYPAIGEIAATIRGLNGNVSLATVSKVVKALESDLIVGREGRKIRLLQPDKLLDELSANYRPPKVKAKYVGRIDLSEGELERSLADAARHRGRRFVLTGAASARNYAVMAREPVLAAYCDELPEQLLSTLSARAERTARFPNVDLTWTDDATVYFEPQSRSEVPSASPVQSYLELTTGDKRQQETAAQVREYVLRRVDEQGA